MTRKVKIDRYKPKGIFDDLNFFLPKKGRSQEHWLRDLDDLRVRPSELSFHLVLLPHRPSHRLPLPDGCAVKLTQQNNGGFHVRDPGRMRGGVDVVIVEFPGPATPNFTYTLSPTASYDRDLPHEEWSLETALRYFNLDSKVRIVQHWWIKACLKERRVLGARDNWGGWRVK